MEKEEVKDEKPKVDKPKKSKKKAIIITIIVLVVIIAAGVGGFFLYRYLELQKPIEQEWGETYYTYLSKEKGFKEDIGFSEGMENTKVQFVQLENEEDPVMIVSYTKNNENYNNIYKIADDNTISFIEGNEQTSLEWLYNIEKKEYDLYLHNADETNDTYISVEDNFNIGKKNQGLTTYIIPKGEETSQATTDGKTITISKFDETFIKLEVEESSKVDFDVFDNFNTKEAIENAINGYKTKDEVITDEVKQNVANKEEELKEKQEEMENAKEELEKQEEEKRKAEEEAKKQEEAKNSLKVGNYTIKYGTYVGIAHTYGPGETEETKMQITINPNGTLTQSGGFSGGSSTISYKVQGNSIIGENNMPLEVTGNNQFTLGVAEGVEFTYQGN